MAEYNCKEHYIGDMHFRVDGDSLKKILPRSVGALTYLNVKKEQMFGTGVLISKDLILTAAHNLYDKVENRFYIGANGQINKFFEVEAWIYPEEFKNCPSSQMIEFDYAVLKLKQEIVYESYLPLCMLCQICQAENDSKRFSIYGFPCIQQNFKVLDAWDEKIRLYQYGDIGKISLIQAAKCKVSYKISSLLGQNGAPVVVCESITAINLGGDSKGQYNIGRFIDAPLIGNLINWRSELKATQFSINEYRACEHVRMAFKSIKNPQTSISLSGLKVKQLKLDYPNLLKVELSQNQVQKLDIRKCPRLTEAYFFDSKLFTIDLRNNLNLNTLQLCINNLEQLDVRINTNLKYLNLGYNNIASLDLRNNTKLEKLQIYNTKLNYIDLSHNSELKVLSLIKCKIEMINLCKNQKLVNLNLTQNKLTSINLTNLQLLEEVFINNNLLTQVDFSNNKRLSSIGVASNKISHIKIYISKDISIDHYTAFTTQQEYYSFSCQDSQSCKIEFSYEEEEVRQKIMRIIQNWTQKYTENRQNLHQCEYSFYLP